MSVLSARIAVGVMVLVMVAVVVVVVVVLVVVVGNLKQKGFRSTNKLGTRAMSVLSARIARLPRGSTRFRCVVRDSQCMSALLFVVCWLLNVTATCKYISGTDLLGQFYVLPH